MSLAGAIASSKTARRGHECATFDNIAEVTSAASLANAGLAIARNRDPQELIILVAATSQVESAVKNIRV